MNQSIFERISNKIAHIDYETLESWKPTEDIQETFKELTEQVNHETDLCKKDFQKQLEKKGKVDLTSKSHLFLSVENEDSCISSR